MILVVSRPPWVRGRFDRIDVYEDDGRHTGETRYLPALDPPKERPPVKYVPNDRKRKGKDPDDLSDLWIDLGGEGGVS